MTDYGSDTKHSEVGEMRQQHPASPKGDQNGGDGLAGFGDEHREQEVRSVARINTTMKARSFNYGTVSNVKC